jgi:hypothetical protein
MLDTETRFCVLGAGAGGLSAAWYLRKRGYRRITILEKSDRIGGKCLSLTHDGVTVDLGAALVMPGYKHIAEAAAEVGAPLAPMQSFRAIRWTGTDTISRSVAALVLEKHRHGAFIKAAYRFFVAHRRHAAVLRQPGFAGMSTRGAHAALAVPFSQWASERGMEPLLTQFQLPFTVFGYGDVARLPAAYVLRYMSALLYFGLTMIPIQRAWAATWPLRFEAGYGGFLQRVAQGFDIRTGARIGAIRRDGGIDVSWTENVDGHAAQHQETFDRLIVACPPGATADAMTWSPEEARLFPLIRAEPYAVTACESTGIPATVSFVEATPGPGHLMQVWKPAPGPGVCALYTTPAPGMTVDDIMIRARDDLRRIHPSATLGRVLHHVDWVYFPRVDAPAFADGFYDDLEALQGAQATWYCGALPAFESMENIFAYSKALVERMAAGVG